MSVKTFNGPLELNRETGMRLVEDVRKARVPAGTEVVIDLSRTRKVDSLGGACLVAISDHVRARRAELRLDGKQGEVADFLAIVEPALAPQPRTVKTQASFVEY